MKKIPQATFLPLVFPTINPVALKLGPIQIHWYGLAYISGILLGNELAKKIIKKINISINLNDLLTAIMLGIILGGRLGTFYFMTLFITSLTPLKLLQFGMVECRFMVAH